MIVSALAEHLWQSTLFALVAASLAVLVRNDTARVRYWIWFAASLKFLVPFSLLTWIGSQFIFQVTDDDALLPLVQSAVAPLTGTIELQPIDAGNSRWLVALWAVGAVAVVARWCAHWLRAHALVVHSTPTDVRADIPVHRSERVLEPCVVGIRQPVLLLPENLAQTLTPAQLDAVIAHETWHVRRRDNLTASMHAAVTAAFWFHPLVWWIGAKLIEAREHACDEGAIDEGQERAAYAEAILRVCEHSVRSRLACVARAAGGDLRARIRWIMSRRPLTSLGLMRRSLLGFVLLASVALPVAAGMNVVSVANIHVAAGARSIRVNHDAGPSFINADDDHVYARNVTLRELIGHAYGTRARNVSGRYEWLDHPRYDVDLRSANGASDQRRLITEFLAGQFNIELIVRPTVHVAD